MFWVSSRHAPPGYGFLTARLVRVRLVRVRLVVRARLQSCRKRAAKPRLSLAFLCHFYTRPAPGLKSLSRRERVAPALLPVPLRLESHIGAQPRVAVLRTPVGSASAVPTFLS